MTPPPGFDPYIALRDDFATTMRGHGYTSRAQIARAADIAESTIGRLLNRTQFPSSRFIARAITACPGCTFDDLFEVRTGYQA